MEMRKYGIGDTILGSDLDSMSLFHMQRDGGVASRMTVFHMQRDGVTVSCVHSVTMNFDLDKYGNFVHGKIGGKV